MRRNPPNPVPWRWEELLPKEMLLVWFEAKGKPRELYRRENISHPGVYRFVFRERSDGNSKHTLCYIGEGGDIGIRLQNHFSANNGPKQQESSGRLKSGFSLRGAIAVSNGDFSLQILTLDGPVEFGAVKVNQHDLDDRFVRRLIENWAILYAEQVEGMQLLNRLNRDGVSQSWNDSKRKFKTAASEGAKGKSRKKNATQE